jgi:hypothetical protein
MATLTNLTSQLVNTFTVAEAFDVTKPLLLFILGVTLYSVFIFKFYRFVAKRDIFSIDLSKYNTSKVKTLRKIVGVLLYALEYLILFPIFAFLWFLTLALLLSFLSKNQTPDTVLLISIAVVGSVRATSYYDEDLSRDLAKMLPFALLGVFLVDITFFSLDRSWQVISSIPSFWDIILYYLVVVILLEFILRILFGIYSLMKKPKKEYKEE